MAAPPSAEEVALALKKAKAAAAARLEAEKVESLGPAELVSGADAAVLDELGVTVSGRLGEGHFGAVLLGESAGGNPVAVKVARELDQEAAILRLLSGTAGFPALLHHHKVVRHYRDQGKPANEILVMDRLGPSLEAVWRQEAGPGVGLPAATVLRIGQGCLRCLRALHLAGVVHNDVKPANIMLGLPGSPRESEVHLIDFGISTRVEADGGICDAWGFAEEGSAAEEAAVEDYCGLPVETQGYQDYLKVATRLGTPAFSSVRQQEGEKTVEADDVEALAYSLAFLSAGGLPWEEEPPPAAAAWKRKLVEEGWEETLGGISGAEALCTAGEACAPSSRAAVALQAMWAEVLDCHKSGAAIDHDRCLAALGGGRGDDET